MSTPENFQEAGEIVASASMFAATYGRFSTSDFSAQRYPHKSHHIKGPSYLVNFRLFDRAASRKTVLAFLSMDHEARCRARLVLGASRRAASIGA